MVRVYAVFNVEQADHVTRDRRDDQDNEPEWKAHQTAERVIHESGIHVAHVRGDRAFYNMQTDKVTLPEREQLATANGYYQIAMHELGHATGHPVRLDRDTLKNSVGNFGGVEYAREELRVEMSAMLTGDCVGVGHDGSRGAAYVKGWITALDHDPREIYKAAADAQHISDYLMRPIRDREQETAQQHRALAEKYSAARSPQISSAPTARPLDPRPPMPVGADPGPRADDRQPEGDPPPASTRNRPRAEASHDGPPRPGAPCPPPRGQPHGKARAAQVKEAATAKRPRREMHSPPMPASKPPCVATARNWPTAPAGDGRTQCDSMGCSTRPGRVPPVGSGPLAARPGREGYPGRFRPMVEANVSARTQCPGWPSLRGSPSR